MLDILQENENSWFEGFRAKTALIVVFLAPILVFARLWVSRLVFSAGA
jgi:hypothetical protein